MGSVGTLPIAIYTPFSVQVLQGFGGKGLPPYHMQYLVVIEESSSSFGAYVPDLPGCIAVGESREEVLRLIREAIGFHFESMKENGLILPLPHPYTEFVNVRV